MQRSQPAVSISADGKLKRLWPGRALLAERHGHDGEHRCAKEIPCDSEPTDQQSESGQEVNREIRFDEQGNTTPSLYTHSDHCARSSLKSNIAKLTVLPPSERHFLSSEEKKDKQFPCYPHGKLKPAWGAKVFFFLRNLHFSQFFPLP